ncbi:MAG: hypothetical protein ACI94Y_001626, partial [Maribacter sp.]
MEKPYLKYITALSLFLIMNFWNNALFGQCIIQTTCPPPIITVDAALGTCEATVTYLDFGFKPTIITSTSCADGGTTQLMYLVSGNGNATSGIFPIGTTINNFEKDLSSTSSGIYSCSFVVIVNDNQDPTITCPSTVTISANSDCEATAISVNLGTPITSDNCSVASVVNNAPAIFPLGNTTVTWTVTDGSNTATCDQIVTVEDNIDPTITCPSTVTISANSDCEATAISVNIGTPITSDNCNVLPATNNAPAIFPLGTTTVTWTVIDDSGNTATCNQTVIVEDNINPTITCPSAVTVSTNSDCEATAISVNLGTPVTADNCSGIGSATNNAPLAFPLGNTIVTWTVTDMAGNMTTCDQIVTVNDNENPIGNCMPYTANLGVGNTVTITPENVMLGGTFADNCNVNFTSVSPSTFNCTNLGANLVTLIVIDDDSNISTCTAIVTVTDTNAACCDISLGSIIKTDETCPGTGDGTITIEASCTSCASIEYSINGIDYQVGNTFSGLPSGAYTISIRDTANSACNATESVTVNAGSDTTDPMISFCPANITVSTNSNCTSAAVSLSQPIATDNCGVSTIVNNAPATFPLGNTTVTWTVTDAAGNSTTCSQIVTVNDNENPTAICKDATIQLDAQGDASIIISDIDNGSSDNCGIASRVLSQTNFDCNDIGTNSVTLTITDNSGNISTCTATVTVEDNTSPITVCQNITIPLDATGNATITTSEIDGGSGGNCGVASLSLSQTDFDCTDIGMNSVILTVTDDNGDSSTCTATVTVEDNIAPIVICQDIVIQLDATGNKTITSSDIDNGSNDNCGISSLSLSQTDFDCTNIGLNTVTLTVTVDSGNSSTCTATVTVQDNENPTAICRNATIQLNAQGDASITTSDIDDGSNDNCGTVVLSLSQTNFDCNDIGTNPVTLIVTDDNDNISTCIAIVTVENNVNLSISCPSDVTTFINSGCTATGIDLGTPIISDNCNVGIVTNNAPASFSLGNTTVTWTLDGGVGNITTCNQIVTVNDNVNPAAICKNIIVQLDATGNKTITISDIDDGSNDNCGAVTLSLSQTNFDCTDVGSNPVTLTATDVTGNTSTCLAIVVVEDNILPTANCQAITVQLDATGNKTITASEIDNGSNDNCGTVSLSLSQTNFDCTDVGLNPVTLTVTDDNGNSSNCTVIVTVEDNIAPIVICQDIVIQLDATGNKTITSSDIDNGSIDNCGIASRVLSQTNFDCNDIGTNSVTLTITDNSGNISTCTATVTVQDNENPTAICQNATIQLNAQGDASITTSDIDDGSNDNCGTVVLSLSQTNFDCN